MTNDQLLEAIDPTEHDTPTYDKFVAFMSEQDDDGHNVFDAVRQLVPSDSNDSSRKYIVSLMYEAFEAGADTADD